MMANSRPANRSSAPDGDSNQGSVSPGSGRNAATNMILPATVKAVLDDGGEKVSILGNCVFVCLSPRMTLNGVSAIEHAFEEITRQNAPIAYLSIIDPGDKSIDSTAQNKMSRVVAAYTKRISGAAIVYTGDGFRATVVRSIITAIHWASRATHPMRVFEDVDSALVWLKNRPENENLDVAAMGDVVRKMMG